MDFNNATFLAFLNAGIISAIMTIVFVVKIRARYIHPSFILAGALQSTWLLAFAFQEKISGSNLYVISFLEALHFSSWMLAIIFAIRKFCKRKIPIYFIALVSIVSLLSVCTNILSITNAIDSGLSDLGLIIWQGLVFSIIGLFTVEQLYRNTNRIRILKLISLNLAALFIYDIFYFTQNILAAELVNSFSQIRAIIALVTSLFIALNVIVFTHREDTEGEQQKAQLSLSRPIVFYSTSLTLAGALLAIVGLGGYYIRIYGGEWGEVAYSIVLVGAVLSIGLAYASNTIREQLGVLVNKHLFSHKYDYRSEWLKLIDQLSRASNQYGNEAYKRALSCIANIFKCSGGAIWLKRGNFFVPVYQHSFDQDISEFVESKDSDFCHSLEKAEWVFFPSHDNSRDSLKQHNEYLPNWTKEIEDLWLIMPLLMDSKLVGFALLTAIGPKSRLNWEDLDLLKTVGRQIAAFLKRHEQAELIAESRQFDTFNKLAAYVMHDLKNIIAQQSLVVANAEKHKDNPAFVDDAIKTISNSVQRMNTLLRKLQRNEPEETRTLNLNAAVVEGVQRCKNNQPSPTLRAEKVSVKIKADWDSLVMVFIHIIQNAQDATPSSGYVDVNLVIEGDRALVLIEDNGEGMDEDFIRDRLFKPFDTTKSGKGMGIGVYQARDYIQSLGGTMNVESELGSGTTFCISLPILDVEPIPEPEIADQPERAKEPISPTSNEDNGKDDPASEETSA